MSDKPKIHKVPGATPSHQRKAYKSVPSQRKRKKKFTERRVEWHTKDLARSIARRFGS